MGKNDIFHDLSSQYLIVSFHKIYKRHRTQVITTWVVLFLVSITITNWILFVCYYVVFSYFLSLPILIQLLGEGGGQGYLLLNWILTILGLDLLFFQIKSTDLCLWGFSCFLFLIFLFVNSFSRDSIFINFAIFFSLNVHCFW